MNQIKSGDQVILYYPQSRLSISGATPVENGYQLVATSNKIQDFVITSFKVQNVTCDTNTIVGGPIAVDNCVIFTTNFSGREFIIDASTNNATLIPYLQNFPITCLFQLFSTEINTNPLDWPNNIVYEGKEKPVTNGTGDLLILARGRGVDLLNVDASSNVVITPSQTSQGTVMSMYKYNSVYSVCCGSGSSGIQLPSFCSCDNVGNQCLSLANIETPECLQYCADSGLCDAFLLNYCKNKKASNVTEICKCFMPNSQYPGLSLNISPSLPKPCVFPCSTALVTPGKKVCDIQTVCIVSLTTNVADVQKQVAGSINISQNCSTGNPFAKILDFLKKYEIYFGIGTAILVILILLIIYFVI